MDYTKKFSAEEHTSNRKLSDEAIEWLQAVRGKKVDFFEGDQHQWLVLVGGELAGEFTSREDAVTLWSHINQQRIALSIIAGHNAQSRQWFTYGEGQKQVSNSTGWTDL